MPRRAKKKLSGEEKEELETLDNLDAKVDGIEKQLTKSLHQDKKDK